MRGHQATRHIEVKHFIVIHMQPQVPKSGGIAGYDKESGLSVVVPGSTDHVVPCVVVLMHKSKCCIRPGVAALNDL